MNRRKKDVTYTYTDSSQYKYITKLWNVLNTFNWKQKKGTHIKDLGLGLEKFALIN